MEDGDIVSIDCGTDLNGFIGDSAYTFLVGEVKPEIQKLLKVTKEALYLGLEKCVEGNRLGDIGYAIQSYVESFGFSVVKDYIGHGIGKNLHEDPEVPNYGLAGHGPRLREGMTIAIEPMVNVGTFEVKELSDGWTVKTMDGSLSAHYENTVALTSEGVLILTQIEKGF